MQTTPYDIYAMQSQLQNRESGVGNEHFTFEMETDEPNPLAITAKELGGERVRFFDFQLERGSIPTPSYQPRN